MISRPPLTRGLILIVLYKSIWGLIEISSGIALFFSKHFIANELLEDPQDHLANFILNHFTLDYAKIKNAAIALLVLGTAKILLSASLVARVRHIIHIYIGILTAAGLVSIYELFHAFSWYKVGILLIDLGILIYLLARFDTLKNA